MKIGILTFWQSQSNYGQILQCWALQKYLISNGYSVFLIRYTHDNPKPLLGEKIKKAIKIYPIFKKIIRFVTKEKFIVNNFDDNKRSFDDFKNNYLSQSPNLYRNLIDLQKNPPSADCYIVGSDQVWAHLLDKKNNEVYYLNFGDKFVKRLSYAASFSMEKYPQNIKFLLEKNLKRFDAISVRERTGVDICKSVGKYAEWVLDPTLLLNKNDYLQFIGDDMDKKKYVFIYLLNIKSPEEIYWDELKFVLKEKGYDLICTTASGYNKINFKLDGCIYEYPSIEQWLTFVYNSSLVVTSSFHGVIFSLLFNKSFVFIPLSGTYAKSNNRVIDLLCKLELTDRIIFTKDNYKEVVFKDIDWEKVNGKIQILRKKSQKFLLTNL